MSKNQTLEEHFEFLHNNPPAPFNPAFDPKAEDRFYTVTKSMEADNWYATHTREECKVERARRYDELKSTSH